MELSIALLCPRPPRRVPDVHDLNDVLAYAIKYFVRIADEEFHLHREQGPSVPLPDIRETQMQAGIGSPEAGSVAILTDHHDRG